MYSQAFVQKSSKVQIWLVQWQLWRLFLPKTSAWEGLPLAIFYNCLRKIGYSFSKQNVSHLYFRVSFYLFLSSATQLWEIKWLPTVHFPPFKYYLVTLKNNKTKKETSFWSSLLGIQLELWSLCYVSKKEKSEGRYIIFNNKYLLK